MNAAPGRPDRYHAGMFGRDPHRAALRGVGDVLGRDLSALRPLLRAALPRGGVIAAARGQARVVTALGAPTPTVTTTPHDWTPDSWEPVPWEPVPWGLARWELASVTKPFTGALAAALVAAGRLEWHAPLSALGGPLRGVPRTVTAWRLATHTAGLPAHPARATLTVLTRYHDPYGGMDARAVLGSVRRWAGVPGRFVYSNLGMGALALACAHADGQECSADGYGRALSRHVTGPLNLDVSLTARRAAAAHAPHTGFGPLAGAGGLFATPDALLSFAQAHLPGTAAPTGPLGAWQDTVRPQGLPPGVQVSAGWLARGPLRWHDGVARHTRTGLAFDAPSGAVLAVLARGGEPLLGRRAQVTRLLLRALE
ncbi:serine hydrolase [Deinococcus knuensis]|uniref:Serine hydrolase n=2 Tax=Deinococcus knuensis TaxID=1837380 RepID=A0ABQ2SQW4_9DEIO|nr:serine hydrolase [Deinococcus knuensis]